jgi:hypothetical protein
MERERYRVNVGVEVDQRQILTAQAQLRTFAEKSVKAVARVLVERLQFDALLRALKDFDNKRYSATVSVDTTGARAELERLERQLSGIRDRTVELNGATRGFGNAADDGFGRGASRFQRLAALFIALSPLMATALSAVVGVLGAVVSAVAIAGVGVGAFAAVAIPTFQKVADAVKAGQEEIDKLPPSLRGAAVAMQEMQSVYQRLVEANEARVGDVMAGGFKVATIVLEQMQPVITAAANGFMRMNELATQFFRGSEFREYTSFLAETMAPTMDRLTQITFSFFAAFGNLTEMFYRFGGSRILDMIVEGMANFASWTDRLGQNQTFLRFMESMERSIPAVGALLRDLLEFIINLTIGLEPLGTMIARVMSQILDGLNSLPPELMAGITIGFGAMWAAIALGAGGPIGLAIGVIAGLAVVLADLATRSGPVRDSILEIVDAVEQRFNPIWENAANNIRNHVIPVWSELIRLYTENLAPVFERLGGLINDKVVPAFGGIVDTITGRLIPAIGDFLIAVEPFVTFMVDTVGGIAVDAVEKLFQVFDGTLKNISSVLNIWSAVFKGDWEAVWVEMGVIVDTNTTVMDQLFGQMMQDIGTTLAEEGQILSNDWTNMWTNIGVVLREEEQEMENLWAGFLGWLRDTFTGWSPQATAEWEGYWSGLNRIATDFENTMDQAWSDFWNGVWNTFNGWRIELTNGWVEYWGGMRTEQDGSQTAVEGEWNAWWRRLNQAATDFETMMDNNWALFWGGIITEQDGSQRVVQGSLSEFLSASARNWDDMCARIRGAWDAFWINVQNITNQSVTNVGNAFRRIANLFRDPINWVINVVLNDGILGAWNTVMSWIGQPGLSAGRIPNLPVFASGGPIHGGIPGKDSVPILTMPGEYVLSKRAVDNMGGVNKVEMIHQAARGGRLDGLGATSRDGLARQHLMRAIPADDAYGRAYAYGGVQPHVARAGQEIERIFGRMPGGIGGVGARANASDHPSGHALDFMTMNNVALGHRVAAHLQANAARMLVKYLIWQQQINSGSGWRRMADRGSPTANHMDHVHASFLRAGQAGISLGGGAAAGAEPVSWWSLLSGQVMGLLNGLIPSAIPGIGGPVGAAMLNIPKALIAKVIDAARKKLESLFTFGDGKTLSEGGPGTGPVVDQVRAVAARYGWGTGPQWTALDKLIQKESSWNPNAQNPNSTAYGLFQFLNSTWASTGIAKTSNPSQQAEAGMRYIQSRYGTPTGAVAFHARNNWYKNGGWLMPGEHGYNETREPEAIFNRPQLTAIDRAINEDRRGGGTAVIDAETIRTIVKEIVGEMGGDTYHVMLPERATVRELAHEIDYRKRVSTKGKYHPR